MSDINSYNLNDSENITTSALVVDISVPYNSDILLISAVRREPFSSVSKE